MIQVPYLENLLTSDDDRVTNSVHDRSPPRSWIDLRIEKTIVSTRKYCFSAGISCCCMMEESVSGALMIRERNSSTNIQPPLQKTRSVQSELELIVDEVNLKLNREAMFRVVSVHSSLVKFWFYHRNKFVKWRGPFKTIKFAVIECLSKKGSMVTWFSCGIAATAMCERKSFQWYLRQRAEQQGKKHQKKIFLCLHVSDKWVHITKIKFEKVKNVARNNVFWWRKTKIAHFLLKTIDLAVLLSPLPYGPTALTLASLAPYLKEKRRKLGAAFKKRL